MIVGGASQLPYNLPNTLIITPLLTFLFCVSSLLPRSLADKDEKINPDDGEVQALVVVFSEFTKAHIPTDFPRSQFSLSPLATAG